MPTRKGGREMSVAASSQIKASSASELVVNIASSKVGNTSNQDLNTDFSQVFSGASLDFNAKQSVSSTGEDAFCLKENQTSMAYEKEQRAQSLTTEDNLCGKESVDQEKDLSTVVEEFSEKVKNAILSNCDISTEELEKTMESLGLTYLDLLNPQNVQALICQLTGIEDGMSLVLDESASDLLLQINDLSQEMMEDIKGNALQEELLQLLEPVEEGFEEGLLINNQESLNQAIPAEITDSYLVQNGETTVKTEYTLDTNSQTIAKDDATITITSQIDSDQEMKDSEFFQPSDQNEFMQSQTMTEQEPLLNNQVIQENASTSFEGALQSTSYVNSSDSNQDVLQQVIDYVSVNASPEESTMELSLTPETLGKIFIKVSQVEGQISASITTTTEEARQALANQMFALKENFNLQGLKVDDVEVAIAPHEFERNLEENAKGHEEEQKGKQQEELSFGHRRNINLNYEQEIPKDLTQAERLQASMMKDQGNSVDLTA